MVLHRAYDASVLDAGTFERSVQGGRSRRSPTAAGMPGYSHDVVQRR